MKRKKATELSTEAYREILLAKRAALISELSATHPDLTDLAQVAEEDQAPILHEEFISHHVKRLDHQTLKLIDAALDRLVSGEYGICTECGHPISAKRLAAIPWAGCCIACQERIGRMPASEESPVRAA